MKKLTLTRLLNYMIIFYIITWGYFLLFNWDVFSVRLNIYLGFADLSWFPFIFFFSMGLLLLIIASIYAHFTRAGNERILEERNQRARMLEKDLEITRLKSEHIKPDAWEDEIQEIREKIKQLNDKIENTGD